MKKILLIGLIVALVLILAGGAGLVYARVRNLDNAGVVRTKIIQIGPGTTREFGIGERNTYGPGGMMGNGYGYGPGGMMGNGYGYGPGGMMGNGYGYGPGGMMGGNGYGPRGMMQGYGYGPGGMMGGRGFGEGRGIMHDYMISAFASAVGLTVDEVNTRLESGETLKEIALAQGKTEADLPALIIQVRQAALNQAVADGVITQAQADLMLEHMKNYTGPGFGPGYGNRNCPMWDNDEAQP